MKVKKMSKQKSLKKINVLDLVKDIHPDDVIYCGFSEEESYLAECADALDKKLAEIAGTYMEAWYNLSGSYSSFDDDEEEGDIPFDNESLSYLLYFISLDNGEATYEREYEVDGATKIANVRAGVVLYISYLAPVAFLHFNEVIKDEDGETFPFIEHPNQLEPNEELGLSGAEDFLQHASPKLKQELEHIKQEVEEVIKQFNIRMITREEARQTCPWLTHDEEVLVGEPPTVFDAFFYRCI
jgi:hypothetical protein